MIKSMVVFILSSIVFFGGGEWAARAYLRTQGDAIDITRSLLVADQLLLWQARVNFDGMFLGHRLQTDDRGWRTDATGAHIYVFGPSSTFGWGVASNNTYPTQLATLIKEPVVNAGEIGYSSAQGKRMIESLDLGDLDARVVILAYGINDADRYRFFFQSTSSDAIVLAQERSKRTISLINALRHSALLQLAARTLARAAPNAAPHDFAERVSIDEAMQNFRDMIALARGNGAMVILMTTATHYTYEEVEAKRIQERMREYNVALRDLAARESVPLLDIETIFQDRDRAALFVDPIHFSPEGNRLVAEGLAAILSEWKTARNQ